MRQFLERTATSSSVRGGPSILRDASARIIGGSYSLRTLLPNASLMPVRYAPTVPSSWLAAAKAALDNMAHLPHGWDSYKAPAPSSFALSLAMTFLESLHCYDLRPDRIAPSAVGGVGMTFWEEEREVYVEFQNGGFVGIAMTDGASEPIITPMRIEHRSIETTIDNIRRYLHGEEEEGGSSDSSADFSL